MNAADRRVLAQRLVSSLAAGLLIVTATVVAEEIKMRGTKPKRPIGFVR